MCRCVTAPLVFNDLFKFSSGFRLICNKMYFWIYDLSLLPRSAHLFLINTVVYCSVCFTLNRVTLSFWSGGRNYVDCNIAFRTQAAMLLFLSNFPNGIPLCVFQRSWPLGTLHRCVRCKLHCDIKKRNILLFFKDITIANCYTVH